MTAAPPNASRDLPDRTRAAGEWWVVPAESQARFQVRDKLVTTVHGALPVEGGRVVLAAGGVLTAGWISLAVPGIATGNARRDGHLQQPRFLSAATSPSVRVEVETATATPTGWTARAVVRARGRSAPLDLAVETGGAGEGRPGGASGGAPGGAPDGEVRIRVTGRLDRAPLGIKAPSFVIGRFLVLEADLTFRRSPGHPRPGGALAPF